jgi:hypothetical protein
MTDANDPRADERRPLWMRNNAHLYIRHDAHLYIRHDAHRFMPPGSPVYSGRDVVKYFWPDEPSQENYPENGLTRPGVVEWTGKRGRWMPERAARERAEQERQERELAERSRREAFEYRKALLDLRADLAQLKFDLAFERFKRTYLRWAREQELRRKAGFRPDQPRVPAGNPDGGQWTAEDGWGNDTTNDARVTLAAIRVPRIPQKPRIPQQRPPTERERNQIARELAREGVEALGAAIAGGANWLYEKGAEFYASFDSPKTLEELRRGVAEPRAGYDNHHIVERATAAADRSENHLINAPENLVRIPRWKHWNLNRWYETPNKDYGLMTPRSYHRGKSWEERVRVGLYGLIEVGVLKR